MVSSDETSAVHAARASFFSDGAPGDAIRRDILLSWRRSRVSGVPSALPTVPYEPTETLDSRLYLAAEPVIERFASLLTDTSNAIVLADRRARIVGRWTGTRAIMRRLDHVSIEPGSVYSEEVVGTNGLGTALETRRVVEVRGPEHYADELCELTCVGTPVRNPISRRIEGAINIACRNRDVNSLLLPMVQEIGRGIEEQLYDQSSAREQALLNAFMRRSRARHPIVTVSEQFMMTNAPGARLLDAADQAVLWEQAAEVVASGREGLVDLTLADGRRTDGRCEPVYVGTRIVGAIIEVEDLQERPRRSPVAHSHDGPEAVDLVGHTRAWRHVMDRARHAATHRSPALLTGEPGVGKLAVAEYLHAHMQPRGDLRVLDAARHLVDSWPAWLSNVRDAMYADGGTVVIRHIESLPPTPAAALASLVDDVPDESGPRLVATTTTDDSSPQTHQGLNDRFDVTRIDLPPLRERIDDVPDLVAGICGKLAGGWSQRRFAPDALQCLMRYEWPGNVRQLIAVVRGLLERTRGDVTVTDLPEEIRKHSARGRLTRIEQLERDAIVDALGDAGGNKKLAAERLGVSRSTFYRKLRRYRIDLDSTIY
jgi:transcriptional regulator of acetoin/glycerol metabolism